MVRNKVGEEIEELLRDVPHNRRSTTPYAYRETALISALFYLFGGKTKIIKAVRQFPITIHQLGHYERRGAIPYAKALVFGEVFDVSPGAFNYKDYQAAGGERRFIDIAYESLSAQLSTDEAEQWLEWIMSKPKIWGTVDGEIRNRRFGKRRA